MEELKNKKSIKLKENVQINKPQEIEEYLGFFTYTRDERKRLNMLFNAIYDRYIKREVKKYQLNYDDVVMLTINEFEECKKI